MIYRYVICFYGKFNADDLSKLKHLSDHVYSFSFFENKKIENISDGDVIFCTITQLPKVCSFLDSYQRVILICDDRDHSFCLADLVLVNNTSIQYVYCFKGLIDDIKLIKLPTLFRVNNKYFFRSQYIKKNIGINCELYDPKEDINMVADQVRFLSSTIK
jgi:hypothetical protein